MLMCCRKPLVCKDLGRAERVKIDVTPYGATIYSNKRKIVYRIVYMIATKKSPDGPEIEIYTSLKTVPTLLPLTKNVIDPPAKYMSESEKDGP